MKTQSTHNLRLLVKKEEIYIGIYVYLYKYLILYIYIYIYFFLTSGTLAQMDARYKVYTHSNIYIFTYIYYISVEKKL